MRRRSSHCLLFTMDSVRDLSSIWATRRPSSRVEVSASRLGVPDLGMMGLEDNLAAVRVFTACTDLILIADGDAGYGNAVNAFYTVKQFKRAGVAGVMLEDQMW